MLSDELAELGALEVTPEMVADALAGTGMVLAYMPGLATSEYYADMMDKARDAD
jgi:hypothetical protein